MIFLNELIKTAIPIVGTEHGSCTLPISQNEFEIVNAYLSERHSHGWIENHVLGLASKAISARQRFVFFANFFHIIETQLFICESADKRILPSILIKFT